MARTTSKQIQAIVLGKEETYPRDMNLWMGTLGVVGEAPFYLTTEQLRWCYKYIRAQREMMFVKRRTFVKY